MKLFNLDSGLMRSLSKFTDCICLSLVYFVSCIPIITVGAASTALYYTVHKVLRHDRGYLFRDYLSSFSSNFRQVTPVWLAAAVIGGVLGADFYISSYYAKAENYFFALTVVVLLGITVWFAWVSYMFPYMARFENTRRQSMKNAILMAIAHLPMTFLLLVMTALSLFVVFLAPFLLFLFPAVYAWLQSYILERGFRKYMSEEDKAKEEERYKQDLC